MISHIDYIKVYYFDHEADFSCLYLIFDSNTCLKDFVKWLVLYSYRFSICAIIIKDSLKFDEEIFIDPVYSFKDLKNFILDFMPEDI